MEIISKRHIESAAAENQYGDDKQCVNLRFIHLSRFLFLVVCHSTLFKVCQRVQIYKIKQYHVVVRVFFFMVYPENGVIEYPKTCLACPNRLFGFSK